MALARDRRATAGRPGQLLPAGRLAPNGDDRIQFAHTIRIGTIAGILALVLRGDVADNPRFIDLIQRARDTAASAFGHQDLPFELLVE